MSPRCCKERHQRIVPRKHNPNVGHRAIEKNISPSGVLFAIQEPFKITRRLLPFTLQSMKFW
jgi:hypothetical protein